MGLSEKFHPGSSECSVETTGRSRPGEAGDDLSRHGQDAHASPSGVTRKAARAQAALSKFLTKE